jgi:hypothetical protein
MSIFRSVPGIVGGAGNLPDFPYPTFPYTTLALMRRVSDGIVVTGYGASVGDVPATDSPYGLLTALQYVTRSDGGTTTISGAVLSQGVNVTGGNIRLAWKPIAGFQYNNTALNTNELRLYSTGSPSSPGANYHVRNLSATNSLSTSSASGTPGRWQYHGIAVNNFTAVGSGADLTNIKYAMIVSQKSGGSSGSTIQYGNIDFVPNPRSKAALIFRIDDCVPDAYNILYPALKAVGAGGYFQPGDVNSAQGLNQFARTTSAQLAEMISYGWQIGSGVSTTEDATVIDGMTSDQRTAEFAAARAYGKSFGRYRDTNDGAYFSNVNFSDMTAWPEMHANRRTLQAFINGNPTNPPLPEGETFPFSDPYLIKVLNLAQDGGGGGPSTTTYAQYAIMQAVANKGVIILACHNDLSTNFNVLQAVNDAIAYAQANPTLIEITTPRKLLAPYNGDTLVG